MAGEEDRQRESIEAAVRHMAHRVEQQVLADEARPKEVRDKEKKEKQAALEKNVDRSKWWRSGLAGKWSMKSLAYYLFLYVTIIYFTYKVLWFVVGIWNCATEPRHCHLFGYTPQDGLKWQIAMGYGPKEAAVSEL
jgi:hypothetical protein